MSVLNGPDQQHIKKNTLNTSFIIVYILTQQGVKIRGLLLSNPNNPLGVIYSKDILQGCLQFAAR